MVLLTTLPAVVHIHSKRGPEQWAQDSPQRTIYELMNSISPLPPSPPPLQPQALEINFTTEHPKLPFFLFHKEIFHEFVTLMSSR
jgi:hypothetical protein